MTALTKHTKTHSSKYRTKINKNGTKIGKTYVVKDFLSNTHTYAVMFKLEVIGKLNRKM